MSSPLTFTGSLISQKLMRRHLIVRTNPYATAMPPELVELVDLDVNLPMEDQLRNYAAAHSLFDVILTAIPVAGMARV
ncbi:hypothetical protein [Phenylobacterium ferrooxidans]|uniref:Uncharacterized protein n=1 Tax=Phenylobacterium ferrooxidans TaxID=2982689 RepID=A0ABW6CQT1_9CAUL